VLTGVAAGGAGDGATRAGVAASRTAAACVDAGAGDASATDRHGTHERGGSAGDVRELPGGLVLCGGGLVLWGGGHARRVPVVGAPAGMALSGAPTDESVDYPCIDGGGLSNDGE